jgi:deazaflavin-dependent oxidoreductase (nitroreductase family)
MSKDHPNHVPGVPMLMPVWLERAQIRFVNPVAKRVARFLPGFAVVEHRGRTSGTAYKTVVNPIRTEGVIAIGLIHGKTNWVKNVLAAGGADIRFRSGTVHATSPRLVEKGDTDPTLPKRVRGMARRAGVLVLEPT